MTQRIDFVTKELIAYRISHRCSFNNTLRERKWMMNAIRQAFQWAEQNSVTVDPDAPYCIVKAQPEHFDSES